MLPALQPFDASPLVSEWLAFVQTHGSPCFDDWPADMVARWFRFHAVNHSIIVVRDLDSAAIVGLAIGWQCFERDLNQHWYANNPQGDCFYFAHCVAPTPAAFGALIREFNARFPRWIQLKLFWRRARRGLVPVPKHALFKLYSLAQRRARKETQHEQPGK